MKKSSSLPSGETLPDEEESYYGERAVGFLCVLMLSISTVLLVLYYLESQEVAAKINAMHRIREFMVSRNQSFEHMNDSAILNEAQKLLQEVVKIDSKIFELQLSIDAFIERISTGWKQHDGHLYYLDAYETAFFYARRALPTIPNKKASELPQQIRSTSLWGGVAVDRAATHSPPGTGDEVPPYPGDPRHVIDQPANPAAGGGVAGNI
uniref:uncharacterized protein LOC114603770 n=1 Tax=Podarcis muralis TaxID=64176 RepID=UPI0010A02D00|nr:uncharacterized protein LOC114603770 [Podarcis muralis]